MPSIYLDNAATSFPKPPQVAKAMARYIDEVGGTVNRSVYGSAQQAESVSLELRERLCRLFNTDDPSHAIITPGTTYSLNQAIAGFLKPGDHAIISGLEHNAVTRPLMRMHEVAVSRIPCNNRGIADLSALPGLVQANTRLVVMSHASNVCGTLQDAATVGEFCKQHGIPFVLDAAQTAGHIPIDFNALNLSALSVPGHKGLLGPQGIGALLLSKDFAKRLTPLIAGGTGSASGIADMPPFLPDRFEAGTPNIPGMYGLNAALQFLEEFGIDNRRQAELALTKVFLSGITEIPGVTLIGTTCLDARVGVVSIDFKNIDNAEAAFRLAEDYGVYTRCGLHCAPDAHRSLGTYPRGTVRFSIGIYTAKSDIQSAIEAVKSVSKG